MLRARTVTQMLQVLDLYRKGRQAGESIERALQSATQRVADEYNVTYQTIGDGYRRRLELQTIEHLHTLLARWDQGDPAGLARLLKGHTEVSNHQPIDQFFADEGDVTCANAEPTDHRSAPARKRETLTVELSSSEMKRLEALAEIVGSTATSLASRFVSDTLARLQA